MMKFCKLSCWGKRIWLSAILMCVGVNVFPQLSEPGIPESFLIRTKATAIISEKLLDSVNIQKLIAEDIQYSIPNRYGSVQQVNLDIKRLGVQTTIAGKGIIWRYKITSLNALSIGVYFKRFNLPKGAKVFIYNEDHSALLGAFTNIDNNPGNELAIAEFKGNHAILEYYEPSNSLFSGELVVGAVSQAYKDIQSALTGRIGINCTLGASWQDEKHAVCLMTYSDAQYSYYCTGFLINNVREDGTPYFQTANHCINTAYEASTLVTYFNYENSSCTNADAQLYAQTLSGATLKAGNSYSDFTLLLINQVPPLSYSPYYAGWDASNQNPQQGTCIHHPNGTPKDIAVDINAPVTYANKISWSDENGKVISTTVPNTHWRVVFDQGNVESGSSGSPLFDGNKRVIGQLHGGGETESFYGKLSLSWNYATVSNQQLKAWLDPDNTGLLKMDGTYARVKPKTEFTTKLTNVCVGAVVQLTDQTKYRPSQWKWKISPSSFAYTDGSDSTSSSPDVIFNSEGSYSVALVAKNSYGADSIAKNDYIVAKKNIQVALNNIPADSILCGSIVTKYPIKASGALQYSFALDNPTNISSSVKADSIYLTLKSGIEKEGSFSTWLKVSGTFGSCKSADSARLKITMQTNNDIENAIRIWPGRNALFSNQCATSQSSEPHPPFSACYSSNSWCNGSSTAIKNTVWFTFSGPSTGQVTIDTHGLNNRIAVYNAESYTDIISGDARSYKILAANEGRSSTDGSSLIEKLSVDPGQQYWLQVDGSNGALGDITIDLVCNSLDVFPNPSNGLFDLIISNENNGIATLEMYSLTGKLLLKKQIEITSELNRYSFDASDYPSGLYILKANINGSIMKTKLMILK